MLLFADGFEDGTNAWTLVASALGTGRFGNGIVVSGTTATIDTGFTPTAGPLIVGFAFKPAAATYFLSLRSGSNDYVILGRGSGGEINVYRASTTNLLGSTAAGVLPAGAWSFVELKATIHDTTGIVVIRVNGVEVLNLSGLDTKDSTATTVSTLRLGAYIAGSMQAAVGNAYDDVYIADTTGTYNNDFLGEITVEHLRPASDDTAQFLGSDANSIDNWALVDEAGAYAGADYVASSTVGHRDLYVPAPSARASTSPVVGVIVNAVAMKSDVGVRTARLNVKEGSGGTVRTGAEQGLPTSFGELRQVFERKGDGTQFTVADVNALRVGIEVVS